LCKKVKDVGNIKTSRYKPLISKVAVINHLVKSGSTVLGLPFSMGSMAVPINYYNTPSSFVYVIAKPGS
jgi:hypothetical protein